MLAGGGVQDDAACRTMLLPGYASDTQAACETAVLAHPTDWQVRQGAGKAYCVPRPQSSLQFEEASPGVFVHRGAVADPSRTNGGDVSNIAFVVGDTSIAVIDAGGSRLVGEQLYLAIRERSALPISHLVLTHMHPDHVFGAGVLGEAGAEILGHENLPRALSDRAEDYERNFATLIGAPGFIGSRVVLPDRAIVAPETIDLGGRVLDLEPRPTAHTATDLTVYDSTAGILFAGDLVFDEHTPALDGSLLGWISLMETLKAFPAKQVVPGHGGPVLTWPDGAEPQREYLEVIAADTRAALEAGLGLGEAVSAVGQSEAGKWRLFDLFNPRNATAAYTELEWE
nr:quinoprotein relay system zinc metallohydrolase 2 [Notoacmeibacter sp. MSK16QG-6]